MERGKIFERNRQRGFVFALAAGCALAMAPAGHSGAQSLEEEEFENSTDADPLETLNRGIFRFNEAVDRMALKPAAHVYRGIVPEYGRERVSNVLRNLKMPVTLLNSFLQGDPKNGFSALWTFVLNTTLGVGGIFDFAGAATDLTVRSEDFGQTLGVWGMPAGPYLILPVLGPSSTRDAGGFAVDWVSDPFTYVEDDLIIARTVARAIDQRTKSLEFVEEIYDTSFDPYATVRSLFLQNRESKVRNHITDSGE